MKRIAGMINLVAVPVAILLLAGINAHSQDKAAPGSATNAIQSIDVSTQPGALTVKLGLKEAPVNPPAAFTVNNPRALPLISQVRRTG